MSVDITGTPPWRAKADGTTHGTPGTVEEVTWPDWARVVTIEVPDGGTEVTVQRELNGGSLDAARAVPVTPGAGPREFVVSGGQQSAQFTSFYVASTAASQAFVAEAEAARR